MEEEVIKADDFKDIAKQLITWNESRSSIKRKLYVSFHCTIKERNHRS